jgi:hypothetical protein
MARRRPKGQSCSESRQDFRHLSEEAEASEQALWQVQLSLFE